MREIQNCFEEENQLPFNSVAQHLLQNDDDGLPPQPVVLLVEFEYGEYKIAYRRRERRHARLPVKRLQIAR